LKVLVTITKSTFACPFTLLLKLFCAVVMQYVITKNKNKPPQDRL